MVRYPILLLTFSLLTGCGASLTTSNGGPAGKNLVSATSGGNANSIVGFTPATGTYASVPSAVVVSFASSSLDSGSASATSSYNISCGGSPLAPQGVAFSSGQTFVTISLPTISGLAAGTSCTFTVAFTVMDAGGNFITGNHTVNYTISSSGASYSDGIWNEQASASSTSAVGNSSGNPFLDHAVPGVVLTGLMVNGSTYVNGMAGIWSSGFSSQGTTTGQVHGAAGTYSTLSCPSGMRMTGVSGRAGSFLDTVGITCMNETQTQTWTSSMVGGAGGNSFTLSCPAGTFATDLGGSASGYLESFYLGCR